MFEKKALRKASIIVVNSLYLKNQVIQKYNIDPEKIQVLYQGIKLSYFRYKERKINTNEILKILYIKTDWRRGRLDLLLDALGSLKDYKFQLSVCGEFPPSKLNSYPNIEIVKMGATPHNKIIELLQNHDIFCTPVIREALGVANMEAMASGIPIVTTNVGGISEVVSQKEGWICEPNDLNSLSEQLLKCINNPEERMNKVRNAKKKVQKFSIFNTIENFETIVKNVYTQM